jgi:hypothetical protein
VGGIGDQVAHHIAVYPDGSYVIGGEQEPHEVWLASLGANDTLLWSAVYQSRPDVDSNGEQASLTGLAPLPDHGFLVSGEIGSADRDAFAFRGSREGMPLWLKTYRSADEDHLSAILALPDGFFAFGSTGFTEDTSSYTDLWAIHAAVDGRIRFADGNGFTVENTAVQWQRITDHGAHLLAPVTVASSTLQSTPPVAFTVNAAAAAGTLLTN